MRPRYAVLARRAVHRISESNRQTRRHHRRESSTTLRRCCLLTRSSQLPEGQLEVLRMDGKRSQVSELDIQVVDRTFLVGDIVQPNLTPGVTTKHPPGVLLEQQTLLTLQLVLSKQHLRGKYDAKDVVGATRILRGDIVLYENWVGLVEECWEEGIVKDSDTRIQQAGSVLGVGPAKLSTVSLRSSSPKTSRVLIPLSMIALRTQSLRSPLRRARGRADVSQRRANYRRRQLALLVADVRSSATKFRPTETILAGSRLA